MSERFLSARPRRPFLALILALGLLALGTPSFALPDFAGLWVDKGEDYGNPAAFSKPLPWSVGQYALYGTSRGGERKSVFRALVAGKAGDVWAIEVWSLDEKGKESVFQILVSGYERAFAEGSAEALKLEGLRMGGGRGKATEIGGGLLAPFASRVKKWLGLMLGLEPPESLSPAGALVVPAGSFRATSLGRGEYLVSGRKTEYSTWFSPLVPMSGALRTESEEGRNVTVLLAFGFDGLPKM